MFDSSSSSSRHKPRSVAARKNKEDQRPFEAKHKAQHTPPREKKAYRQKHTRTHKHHHTRHIGQLPLLFDRFVVVLVTVARVVDAAAGAAVGARVRRAVAHAAEQLERHEPKHGEVVMRRRRSLWSAVAVHLREVRGVLDQRFADVDVDDRDSLEPAGRRWSVRR